MASLLQNPLHFVSKAHLVVKKIGYNAVLQNYSHQMLKVKYYRDIDNRAGLKTCQIFQLCKNYPILPVHEAVQTELLDNQDVCIRGWVKSVRKMGKKNTFIDVFDGLSPYKLQIVADTKSIHGDISFHSAVSVVGVLVKSKHKGQSLELHAKCVDLINPTLISSNVDYINNKSNCAQVKIHPEENTSIKDSNQHPNKNETSKQETYSPLEDKLGDNLYPFAPRKRYPDDYCRKYPQFRSKLADFGCILRIRSAAIQAVHEFFLNR